MERTQIDRIQVYVDLEATGRNIKRLREKSGISVAELSDILYVSQQAIFKWQRGEALPSVDNAFVISRLFGVHMEDLFVAEDSRSSAVYNPGKMAA